MTFDPFRVVVPPYIFGSLGPQRQANLYFENIYASSRKVPVDVRCDLGSQMDEQWIHNFNAEARGVPLRIDLLDPDYLNERPPLGRGETRLEAAALPAMVNLPKVLIGDSILASGVTGQHLLDEAAKSTANPAGFGVTPVLIGAKGSGLNRHESMGGWDFENFAKPTGSLVAQNSFIASGGTTFNYYDWLQRVPAAQGLTGIAPKVVEFAATINAIYYLIRDEDVADECDRQLDMLDRMIGLQPDPTYGSVKAATPDATIVVAMPSPPTISQDGFGLVNKSGQTRDRYKRNHVIACAKILDRYGKLSKSDNVWVDGWHVVADPVHSYGYTTTAPNAIDGEQIKRVDNNVHGTDLSKLIGQAIWRRDNTMVARGWIAP